MGMGKLPWNRSNFKAFSVVQIIGKGSGIFIRLGNSTHRPCTDMKALITWAIVERFKQMQLS